ncbi:unnamed protein product [Staurois parvus]|uniref:Uncharacterized protein n=1 Tax=Staurois parvus TaxID=386267 RepID=A0ABN9AJU9_9NEOB|nr:unnamed protein product [Staurois parvus]
MGPPGNRGSWGPCVLAQTQKSLQAPCDAFRFLQGCLGKMPKNCPQIVYKPAGGSSLPRGGLTSHGAPGQ